MFLVELSKRAARFGPGLKSPDKKRAAKSRPEPDPIRAFGPARFLKKKKQF
jgi:hypothetical protein